MGINSLNTYYHVLDVSASPFEQMYTKDVKKSRTSEEVRDNLFKNYCSSAYITRLIAFLTARRMFS